MKADFYYPIFNKRIAYVKTKPNTLHHKAGTKALRLEFTMHQCTSLFKRGRREFTLQVDALWRLINTYSFCKAIISTGLFNAAIYAEIFMSLLEMADLEHLV